MMFVAGCDIGSLTSKAVILKDNKIAGSCVITSKPKPWESANAVMDSALRDSGLSMDDIDYCVGTGYGRDKIPFINEAVSEIACHGKGARWLLPSARTVIDIGGQDCKAMKMDENGKVNKFITNDKCASGTGRFLEVMSRVLDISLDELGTISSRAESPITLASTCTVWAQADVIRHLNNKVPVEDIAAGINTAMASRMAILVNSVGMESDVCMTGGVAKNNGVLSALEQLLGIRIKRIRRADPQVTGALGAALFALEKNKGGSE
ncbi:MAG: 2-hydroxyglutaryl-CoA dehydratase [bacterium]|nr:2-hydroxyglutaryl-CoA dehydratase [bacterium]